MKYKVGDKVKIRKDLDTNKIYGDWDCSTDMARCSGMIATITNCYDDYYHIDIDDECYKWTDGMLEDYTRYKKEAKAYQTVDVGFHLDYCGHRVLKNVLQGETGINRHYYTKNYDIQYIIPIDAIDFIIPHED